MGNGAIAVYGATGYTGTLVARELRRRGIDCVLAGRDAGKLARLAEQLGGGVETHAVELEDRDGLRHLLGDRAVVIDCAGPFMRWGEPVVRAAVETGTHYVDTTGEQSYVELLHRRFGDAARAAEVAVIPAAGFDYLPGDLVAALAADGLGPLRELTIAYATSGVRPTRGTTRTALEQARDGGLVYEGGDWRPAPLRVRRARFRFPAPLGWQPVTRYPSGEVAIVPRHVETERLTTLMTVETLAGSRRAAPLMPLLMPAFALALRTPLGALLHAAVDRLREGPSEAQRAAESFTVVAVAETADGRRRAGVVRGGDVYGTTAATVVESAARMATPGFGASGVLAPAQAFDPASFLDAVGLRWELDPA